MELRAISRLKRRHADLDLSAEQAATVRARDRRAAEAEFFEAAWDEPAPDHQGLADSSQGTELEGAVASWPTQELGHENPSPPIGKVLLAVGPSYFHDGTVGEGLYEADLPLTLVATFEALHVLARAIFAEMGAARDAEVTINCARWLLRLGPATGQAQLIQVDPDAPSAPAPTERRAEQWLRGLAALRQADHPQALAAFEAEAAAAVAAGSPQRAAIAFRAAAASARSIGRADQSNRFLRLAGKSYLDIAEGTNTLPQGVFSAYREAARAFLEAGNLPLAQQCLTKALAVGEALGLLERS
jgi:tetratricopeptide (TPR) repeat protein